ncbi:MAG: hypothetical protein R2880_02380 [Deinococcales bacterium]
MLISTLIPTLLHFFLALIALCLPYYPWYTWLVESLSKEGNPRSNISAWWEAFLLTATGILPLLILVSALFGLRELIAFSFEPVGEMLYAVAMWAGGLF